VGDSTPNPPGTFTAEHSPPQAPPPRRAVTGTNPAPARDPAGPREMLAERGASSPTPAQEGLEPGTGGRTACRPGQRAALVPAASLVCNRTVHRQAKPIKAAEPLGRVNWLYWGTAPTFHPCLGGDARGAGAEPPRRTRAALGVYGQCQAEGAEARAG